MASAEAIKIFYADDDADDRELFEEALSRLKLPLKLACFEGGRQLEKALAEQVYECDLVFLDLNMPGWSGLQTLSALQPAIYNHKLKVVVFTTSADAALVLQTYKLHAVMYLQKPNDFKVLVNSLGKVINGIDALQLPVTFEDFQFFPNHG